MLYDSVFQTDLEQLAIQMMPTKWRKPRHIAFIKLMVFPFKKQLETLRAQRKKNIYVLTHDSRVGRVEKVLNDRFDTVQRRIRIGAGNRINALYLYTEAEAQQTYLPKIIYSQQEIADKNTDFTVEVPADLNMPISEINALRYLTTKYTDKDKLFKIVIV